MTPFNTALAVSRLTARRATWRDVIVAATAASLFFVEGLIVGIRLMVPPDGPPWLPFATALLFSAIGAALYRWVVPIPLGYRWLLVVAVVVLELVAFVAAIGYFGADLAPIQYAGF